MSRNWFVITGGPSTGKSTLIGRLREAGYIAHDEAARIIIDQSIKKGISVKTLRKDEKKFQELATKKKREFEDKSDPGTVTFFDRGMHDTLAYLEYYGFKVEDWVRKLAEESNYNTVFLLEPLENFEKDYARTEDQRFTDEITGLLLKSYKDFGIEPVLVPDLGLEKRVEFVLNYIHKEE